MYLLYYLTSKKNSWGNRLLEEFWKDKYKPIEGLFLQYEVTYRNLVNLKEKNVDAVFFMRVDEGK